MAASSVTGAPPTVMVPAGSERTASVRLAVLIPVHNDQEALWCALRSLCADGAAFDVVVVDDGSVPPLRLPEHLPFHLRLLRLDANRGIAGALNAGLEHIVAAGYEYVARLDAGDLSLPGRLAAQMAFLDQHPDHAMVGSSTEWVDPDGRSLFVFRPPTTDTGLRRFQRYRVGFVHAAVMLRVAALRALGGYDPGFSGAEDFELFLRLSRGYKLANLPEVYLRYVVSPTSLSARRFRHGIMRLHVLWRYFEPFSVHAYLGFARNVLLLLVTRGLVLRVKTLFGQGRRPNNCEA